MDARTQCTPEYVTVRLCALGPGRPRAPFRGDAMRLFCVAVTAAAVTVVCSSAWAQQGTAELRGTAVDQQNAALPGVSITVRNQDTGMFRETTSNPDGTYFISGLTPGVYQIRASLSASSHGSASPARRIGARSGMSSKAAIPLSTRPAATPRPAQNRPDTP